MFPNGRHVRPLPYFGRFNAAACVLIPLTPVVVLLLAVMAQAVLAAGLLGFAPTNRLPNRFLASFAKFAYDHNNVSYCRQIVVEAFEAFFQNIVMHYPGYQDLTFNCIGSVGYNFRDALTQVARSHGMEVGKIIRSPIDDLVSYHE